MHCHKAEKSDPYSSTFLGFTKLNLHFFFAGKFVTDKTPTYLGVLMPLVR